MRYPMIGQLKPPRFGAPLPAVAALCLCACLALAACGDDNEGTPGPTCADDPQRCLSEHKECLSDADCAGHPTGSRCDTTTYRCVACLDDAHCGAGESCAEGQCYLPCGSGGTCPDGTFCLAGEARSECIKKACSADADCTEASRPHCDTTLFACTEKPLPAVKPEIAFFRVSPPLVPLGAEVKVVFELGFKAPPHPLPACTIDGGVGALTLGDERHQLTASVKLTGLVATSRSYTVTCTSEAGTATAQATLAATAPFSYSATLPAAGGKLTVGPYGLDVPRGAVPRDTAITVKLAPSLESDDGLVGMVASFEPDGLSFSNPITLTMPYDPQLMAAAGWGDLKPQDLHIAASDGNGWRQWVTTVDETKKTLTAKISHFSEQGPRKNDRGKGWHPLVGYTAKSDVVLVKQEELAVLHGGSTVGTVLDDSAAGYKKLLGLRKTSTADTIEHAVMADVDGDGRDELAVVYRYLGRKKSGKYYEYLMVKVYNEQDNGPEVMWASSSAFYGKTGDSFYRARLAPADVDGDGKVELVLAGSLERYQGSDRKTDGRVWVLQYNTTSTGKTKVITADTFKSTVKGTWNVGVAGGDVDGDGRDEIALTGLDSVGGKRRMKAWVLDDHSAGYKQLHRFFGDKKSKLISKSNYTTDPWVALAHMDTDDKAEVVLGGRLDSFTVRAELFNDHKGAYYPIGSLEWKPGRPNGLVLGDTVSFAIANLNRDPMNEVVVAFYTSNGCSAISGGSCTVVDHGAFARAGADEPYKKDKGWTRVQAYGEVWLASGDTNKDGRDEVFVCEGRSDKLTVTQYEKPKDKAPKKGKSWTFTWDDSHRPVIALGDMDGDNMKVRFTGEVKTVTPNPVVMLVMAAPPVKKGINQSYGSSCTSYAHQTSSGSSKSSSLGLSLGATISYKSSGFLVEKETSLSLEYQFRKTKTTTRNESYGYGFQVCEASPGGTSKGSVVYYSQTYDLYKYEVLAHTDENWDSKTDQYISIDDPNYGTYRYFQTVEYFNQNNGDAPDIDSDTLGQTPGDPGTYDDRGEMEQKVGQSGWRNPKKGDAEMPVPQGENNSSTLTISVGQQTSDGSSHSFGAKLTHKMTIAKSVGMAASVGISKSWAYTVTNGEQTSYVGKVGGIGGGDYSTYKYNYGLFVYDRRAGSNADDPVYQVMDYWVDGYKQ